MAATYVVSHLTQSDAAASILVTKCDLVPKLISLIAGKSVSGLESHSLNNLITSLANLCLRDYLFEEIMKESSDLITCLCVEAINLDQQETVTQALANISEHKCFYSFMDPSIFQRMVVSVKSILITGVTLAVRQSALTILINACISSCEARAAVLDSDLVDILEESGVIDVEMNMK